MNVINIRPFARFGTICTIEINVNDTRGAVLCLAKLQTEACNFTESNTPPWCLSRFSKLYNGTKLREVSHMFKMSNTGTKTRSIHVVQSFYCQL